MEMRILENVDTQGLVAVVDARCRRLYIAGVDPCRRMLFGSGRPAIRHPEEALP